MKKVLAVILTALLLAAVMMGCSKDPKETNNDQDTVTETPDPTKAPEPTDDPAPTEEPEPVVEEPAVAAGTVFNAFTQFDTESPTGDNVPWVYYFTADAGNTFDPCTILEATDGLQPWHPWGGNWTGVGLNADVPDRVELNTDMLDGINGALGFKAPADGTYGITGSVSNPWDQTADLLHARLNGADLFTVDPGNSETELAEFPYTEVELKAGDIVFFYVPSLTADGWVSAYVDVNFTYAPEAGGAVAAGGYDPFAQFDKESATGDNVPWTYNTTTDDGATFVPCTVVEAMDKLVPWHPVEGNWTGVGLNGDVANSIELNADSKGGSYGALGFKAPADGTYKVTGTFSNPWDQTADLLHARLNGADVFTVEPGTSETGPVPFEQAGVAMKAGEILYFYVPSTTEGGWVSAYLTLNIVAE